MTATLPKIPDALTVLRRAEQRATGEEPGDLSHLADAVRVQIVEPLTAGTMAAAQPADDVQVTQLLADKQRLGDLVIELRKMAETRGNVIDRQTREIAELKQQLAAANADTQRRIDAAVGAITTATSATGGKVVELRAELTAKQREIDEARAERDTAHAQLRDQGPAPAGALEQAEKDNARLADQLACALRDLRFANKALDEIADEAESTPTLTHTHRWPIPEPGGDAQPCECGQPFLRYAAAYETDEAEVSDVEPWAAFFDRIRYELHEDWPK